MLKRSLAIQWPWSMPPPSDVSTPDVPTLELVPSSVEANREGQTVSNEGQRLTEPADRWIELTREFNVKRLVL